MSAQLFKIDGYIAVDRYGFRVVHRRYFLDFAESFDIFFLSASFQLSVGDFCLINLEFRVKVDRQHCQNG